MLAFLLNNQWNKKRKEEQEARKLRPKLGVKIRELKVVKAPKEQRAERVESKKSPKTCLISRNWIFVLVESIKSMK